EENGGGGRECHVEGKSEPRVLAEHAVEQRDQEREARRPMCRRLAEQVRETVADRELVGGAFVEERVERRRDGASVEGAPCDSHGQREGCDREQLVPADRGEKRGAPSGRASTLGDRRHTWLDPRPSSATGKAAPGSARSATLPPAGRVLG